uniref:Uncharacterized protein n=1 Tax=Amphimedon queenslandica TaxID=400682 RepID=A0A1X7U9M0_AMPQE
EPSSCDLHVAGNLYKLHNRVSHL